MSLMHHVPDGTVAEVLDWVGDSVDRARAAITAEEYGVQRSTLLAKLEAIASAAQPQEAEVSETQYDAPEQPTTIVLDANDEGTVIGPVHVRDADVNVVAEEVDIAITSDDDIAGDQVEYLQVVGATNGVVLALNGTPFSFSPQMAASLKTAFDKAVAGLSL